MPQVRLPDLVIPNAATESNVLSGKELAYLTAITIWSPDTLPEAVVVHTAPDAIGAPDFGAHQSGGVDITLPAAKATTITDIGTVGALKLVASVAVAADRTFIVRGHEPGGSV